MDSRENSELIKEVQPHEYGTMTLQEFLASDLEGFEFLEGELLAMPPTSGEHGDISSNIQWYLQSHVRKKQLGRIYTSDTGFQVGDRVLIPDVAFLSSARLPEDRQKAFEIPPDLAVEIISTSDTQSKVARKALAYLEAGTRLVWVIEPTVRTVTVYRSETNITLLTRKDILSGEDVIEGFSCPVEKLFE